MLNDFGDSCIFLYFGESFHILVGLHMGCGRMRINHFPSLAYVSVRPLFTSIVINALNQALSMQQRLAANSLRIKIR